MSAPWTQHGQCENLWRITMLIVISHVILVKEILKAFERFSAHAQEALLDLTTYNHTANNNNKPANRCTKPLLLHASNLAK